eukprot:TRINITY_DN10083_c0_g4_i1.p1 TRINITY_DN10083_c0_g4~~TRINITY_DN10083_c0_g4_i1.p1  ORF type:complete len:202 (+),score=35.98 TRINITY_DN10083_c0_g4_i1:129-734(+)
MNGRLSQIPPERTLKVIMLGNSGVGKTSILHRFMNGTAPDSTVSTIGAEMYEKVYNQGPQRYRLQLWDTAGEEKFRSVTASYFRNGNAVLLVYDVADMASFYELRPWIQDVKNYFGENQVAIIMVANKVDRERMVDSSSAKSCAEEMRVEYAEISVKTGEGCDDLWTRMAEGAVRYKKIVPSKKETIRMSTSSTESQKSCC